MLVAVPYSNGEICPHFGKAPQFKLYTVEDGKVIEAVIVDTVGSGHAALADFLKNQNVNIVIAGGIGNPAVLALASNGIDVVPGIAGNPDQALRDLLDGTLVAGVVGCGCGCGEEKPQVESCCTAQEDLEGGCGCGTHKEASGESCSIDEGAKGCGCGCSTSKSSDKTVQ